MKPLYRKIHSHFRLNGISFSHDELKEVSYSLIKEGEAFEKQIGDFLLDWLDDNPFLQVLTSGSTGKPKSIRLQKRHMVNSAVATGEFFGLQPGNTALLCLPATYIAGKMMLVRAMVLGLELDYVAPSSHPINAISKSYDFCAMVPLQLENSLENIKQIKTLIIGGAPISQILYGKIQDRIKTQDYKTEIFESYGMTETITHIALKRIAHNGWQTTSFKTLPKVTVAADERGCLVIDAPSITDAPVVTNDVVELFSKTEFEWMGRYDNVINSGGIKLFPEQIEAKLAAAISCRFFVAGLPDEKLGQKLILVVEGTVDKQYIFREIKALTTIGEFEFPKEIHAVTEFQVTDSGKIQRNATLERIMG